MANFSLVVNSKFNPFSFERYIQPYQIYGQAYREVENTLGELDTKASIWEEMANEQTDPYAYKMYKTYANDLEEQAGQLAREGLNAASRRDMLNMRARYSKEITPIEQAYTARQKQAEQQQQALLQDPTLLLSRRASTTSLDDYIRNPQLAYEAYSGKLITAQAASAASALAKEMQEKPRKWRSILGNSYYETMMQKGFSSQAVLQAIQDNPDAAPQLTRIVEDAINSSGVRDWGDQATIARAIDYAKQGLWSAVGETQYQTLDNWRAKMAEQEAMQKRAEKKAAARAQQDKGFELNPSNIYSSRKLDASEKKYKNAMKHYSKYFYKDSHGQMRMTWAGWKEYNRNVTPRITTAGSGSGTARLMNAETQLNNNKRIFTPTEFRKFMDSIGASKVKGWQPGNLGNIWNKHIGSSPSAITSRYDAMKYTEYIEDLPSTKSFQDDYKNKLSRAYGRIGSVGIVDLGENGVWEDVSRIKVKDLLSDKYTIISRAPGEVGYANSSNHNKPTTTLIIKDNDTKETFRVVSPPGINTTAENGRDEALLGQIWAKRQLMNPNLSNLDRYKIKMKYDEWGQQIYMYDMQQNYVNQITPQEAKPFYNP